MTNTLYPDYPGVQEIIDKYRPQLVAVNDALDVEYAPRWEAIASRGNVKTRWPARDKVEAELNADYMQRTLPIHAACLREVAEHVGKMALASSSTQDKA